MGDKKEGTTRFQALNSPHKTTGLSAVVAHAPLTRPMPPPSPPPRGKGGHHRAAVTLLFISYVAFTATLRWYGREAGGDATGGRTALDDDGGDAVDWLDVAGMPHAADGGGASLLDSFHGAERRMLLASRLAADQPQLSMVLWPPACTIVATVGDMGRPNAAILHWTLAKHAAELRLAHAHTEPQHCTVNGSAAAGDRPCHRLSPFQLSAVGPVAGSRMTARSRTVSDDGDGCASVARLTTLRWEAGASAARDGVESSLTFRVLDVRAGGNVAQVLQAVRELLLADRGDAPRDDRAAGSGEEPDEAGDPHDLVDVVVVTATTWNVPGGASTGVGCTPPPHRPTGGRRPAVTANLREAEVRADLATWQRLLGAPLGIVLSPLPPTAAGDGSGGGWITVIRSRETASLPVGFASLEAKGAAGLSPPLAADLPPCDSDSAVQVAWRQGASAVALSVGFD